jgi:hypothetical protein
MRGLYLEAYALAENARVRLTSYVLATSEDQ